MLNFPTVLAQNSSAKDYSLEQMLKDLASLSATSPTEFPGDDVGAQSRAKNEALSKCAKHFIRSHISQTFPILDPNIFKLKRWVKLRFEGDDCAIECDQMEAPAKPNAMKENGLSIRWVKCDLIAKIVRSSYSSNNIANIGRVKWPSKRYTEAVVRAHVPAKLPKNIRNKGYELLALAYEAYSLAYKNVLSASVLQAERFSRPDVSVIWIPRTEDLYVEQEIVPPPSDPALIIQFLDQQYVAGTWDLEEEQPFKHLIEEFS
jgi:hypothetical protein